MTYFYIVFGVSLAALGAFALTTRGRRILRIGSVSARIATSSFGSRLRRLFAAPEARARIDAAQRKANAEAVTHTMGQMKGAMMKLGQIMSFISDDVPEEWRAARAAPPAHPPPPHPALLRRAARGGPGLPPPPGAARRPPRPRPPA